jgi:hypothetical protein
LSPLVLEDVHWVDEQTSDFIATCWRLTAAILGADRVSWEFAR